MGIVVQSWRDHGKWRVRELRGNQESYYAKYSTEKIRPPWDVDELLIAVGLTEQATSTIRMLSGGQQRRLDEAIGPIGRPELLFLDEPTTGLDPSARREFHGLIRRMASGQDTTILITTHDLDEADKLAGRMILLAEGRIIANSTSAELSRQIAGEDEVSWNRGGQHFAQSNPDSNPLRPRSVHRVRRDDRRTPNPPGIPGRFLSDPGWKFQTHIEEVLRGAEHLFSAAELLTGIWGLLSESPPAPNDQRLLWAAGLNEIIQKNSSGQAGAASRHRRRLPCTLF